MTEIQGTEDRLEPDRIFRETRNVSRLNLFWDRARAEKNSHSPDSEYRATAQLDFEDFCIEQLEDSPVITGWLTAELQNINDTHGKGRSPRERWDPEYISWKEATRRYLVCQHALKSSGFGGIGKAGEEKKRVSIHLYNEDPFRWIGQLAEERIRKIKNCVIILVGDTGSAKSYSSIQLARYLDKSFNIREGVALDEEEFFNRIGDDTENVVGRVTVADDMSKWANAREYGGDINIILAKMFDIFRSRGEVIIITVPKETKIDKSIRENVHIYLTAPNKNSQGVFRPGDPMWDDRTGQLKSEGYYKFPGYTLLSPGADCDDFEIVIDTVRFPFSGMHEMTPEEVSEGIKDIRESARQRGNEVPSDWEIRSKIRPGRDCRGTPWPNDPMLREYELKKKEVFGEAVKEGRYVIEQAKAKRKFENERMQEQIDELEWRRQTKERRRKAEEEKLTVREEKTRMEKKKLSMKPVKERVIELAKEGLSVRDTEDKMRLEGYTKGISKSQIGKIRKEAGMGVQE